MPTFAAIIIFAYFAALILLIIAGLFLLFKYSEYNENLQAGKNDV
tara:strand:+ start:16 stop:150 length:135 start_codon:yes stop_codon:yes gene_type:complete